MTHITNYKKNIRRIAVLYLVLFCAVLTAFYKYVFVDSRNAVTSPYNRRLGVLDAGVQRGQILDTNGKTLVKSIAVDGGFSREYIYGEMFAHILGYMSHGKYGVEAKYNFNLQSLTNELWQRIENNLFNTPLIGDDLVLTLDLNIQKIASELLNGHKGAIVVMEPSTGKILAQVSYPSFDPNTLVSEWNTLSGDTENSPLLNRATQGLYPPGSTFKILTYMAGMEAEDPLIEGNFECTGEATFENSKIRCFNSVSHGHMDITGAFAASCNYAFASIGLSVGVEPLTAVADRLYFNKAYDYPLDYYASSFALDAFSGESEIVQTAIGQGKTLVTPMHLAMITSAIANNGIMMKPYIADYSIGYNGNIKNKHIPESLSAVMSSDTAFQLTQMMTEVVENGTAKSMRIEGLEVAAKTGTAQNSSGDDHGLIVAFAPAQNPKVVVAVVLENSGGSVPCQAMAREIINLALKNTE